MSANHRNGTAALPASQSGLFALAKAAPFYIKMNSRFCLKPIETFRRGWQVTTVKAGRYTQVYLRACKGIR